jgi:hypothetical protein
MSISSDGQICYGIHIGEELPWVDYDEDDDFDEEEWWRSETGFVRQHRELFDQDGGYVDGVEPSDEECSAYFEEQRDWLRLHPLPFIIVNCCSYDYPDYILAIPGTFQTVSRGYPEEVRPFVVDDEKLRAFREFVEKYSVVGDEKWYLSSLYG